MHQQDELEPVVVDDGVSFELPGVRIGTAEYREGPTGCSVFHFPDGADCDVDVRGGSPGLFGGYPHIDALFLTGGSLYGMEVGSGVAAEIFGQRKSAGLFDIACVSGAVIFDYLRRDTLVHPDKRLGAAAFRAAVPGRFPVGARGAGCRASVGQLWAEALRAGARWPGVRRGNGRGSLHRRFHRRQSARGDLRRARAAAARISRRRDRRTALSGLRHRQPSGRGRETDSELAGRNTTITALLSIGIPPAELRQFGRQIHTSMAQVIRPFHTPYDGDILFFDRGRRRASPVFRGSCGGSRLAARTAGDLSRRPAGLPEGRRGLRPWRRLGALPRSFNLLAAFDWDIANVMQGDVGLITVLI